LSNTPCAVLQATQLVEGRVPLVGIAGVLADSPLLTFSAKSASGSGVAGVLTVPALKVRR